MGGDRRIRPRPLQLTLILSGLYALLELLFLSHTLGHAIQHVLLEPLLHVLDHYEDLGTTILAVLVLLDLLTILVALFLGLYWVSLDALLLLLITRRILDSGGHH